MISKVLSFIPGVLIPMVVNFLLTILYASLLDPGQYGILNIYLTTIQIVYAVTVSIFQNASLRYYSINDSYSDESVFISSYLFGNIIVTIILVPIVLLINIFISFNWWIIVLSIGTNGLFQFLCNLYRLKNKSGRYNFSRSVTSIGSIILLVIFSFFLKPLTYVWPIISVYGSYGILVIFEIISISGKISVKKISKNLLKESINYGFPLIGVTVLGYIVASSDQYFLLYFLGDEAVGNYALGYRLVDTLVVNMLSVVLLVMTPELNRQYDNEIEASSINTLKNMINASVWIILPISFAIIVYASYIVKFVFPSYIFAAHVMQLVVFASMFHGISMFTCKGLELVKKPKYIFYGLLISALINCLYNAIFIPIYGVDASAHSSIIAYIVYNILIVIFTRKHYNLKFDMLYIAKSIIATTLTVASAFIMMRIVSINNISILIVEGIICILVYICFSYMFDLINIFKD